jgi:signal transduction histidine kinase
MRYPDTGDPVLELVANVHAEVIQRLAGASMALSSEPVSDETRRRAAAELAEGLDRLREILACAVPSGMSDVDSPRSAGPALGDLVRSVLTEALANVHRHAVPATVSITVNEDAAGIVLEVLNDGVPARAGNGHQEGRAGIGLCIADAEAQFAGGRVEAGPETGGTWRFRLHLPT